MRSISNCCNRELVLILCEQRFAGLAQLTLRDNMYFLRLLHVDIESDELQVYLDFACDIVEQAGHKTLEYFRKPILVDRKASDVFDPVTDGDRAAEQLIREKIRDTWPTHGIRGEEFDDIEGDRWTWVIDPIDGTRAFISGMLHWGVLLALCDHNKATIGVMYQPFTEELFVGSSTGSTYRRGTVGQNLATKSCSELRDAILLTTSPRLFEKVDATRVLKELETTVKLTRFGGDCYQYAMLAMGMVDLVVETTLKPWDIQALIPLVEGAGGVISTWDGNDPNLGGNIVASCDAELHEQTLNLIRSVST